MMKLLSLFLFFVHVSTGMEKTWNQDTINHIFPRLALTDLASLSRVNSKNYMWVNRALQNPEILVSASRHIPPEKRFYLLKGRSIFLRNFKVTSARLLFESTLIAYTNQFGARVVGNSDCYTIFEEIGTNKNLPLSLTCEANYYRAHMRVFQKTTNLSLSLKDALTLFQETEKCPDISQLLRINAIYHQLVLWSTRYLQESVFSNQQAFEKAKLLIKNPLTPLEFLKEIKFLIAKKRYQHKVKNDLLTDQQAFDLFRSLLNENENENENRKDLIRVYLADMQLWNRVDSQNLPLYTIARYLKIGLKNNNLASFIHSKCAFGLADLECQGISTTIKTKRHYLKILNELAYEPSNMNSPSCKDALFYLACLDALTIFQKRKLTKQNIFLILEDTIRSDKRGRIQAKAQLTMAILRMSHEIDEKSLSRATALMYLQEVIYSTQADLLDRMKAQLLLNQQGGEMS